MPVLKHISPVVVPMAPKALPWHTVPSCNNKTAGIVESGIFFLLYFKNKFRKSTGEKVKVEVRYSHLETPSVIRMLDTTQYGSLVTNDSMRDRSDGVQMV